ncbi:conserved hypothetical protein [Rhodococcus jostii RHA1]|uniref:Uncharacterized protein n=1 Tax=Rhodococcus jostii (strain RHA1) TaxID=101510 RepID=Q0SG40_RHOJR|nr:conserved hypothetical protein [Rhodococcus jostii RHA1]
MQGKGIELMSGYVLNGAGRVELPNRPLAVTVAAVTTAVAVRATLPDGRPAEPALYPRVGLLILPRVDSEIVVVARPDGESAAFPDGTVLQVTIGVDSSRDLDSERAELTPVDVSGLHQVELATIAPAGPRVAITARRTVVDVSLTDVGSRARSAARSALALDRLPEPRRFDVEVDVDTTMSMLARIDDGSIRTVIDVLAGVAAVVGAREELAVHLIGHSVTTLPVTELRDVANQVQAELDSAALGMGFRSAAVDRGERDTRTLAFTVTDAVPADWSGECTDAVIRHLVLVGDTVDGGPGVTVVPSTAVSGSQPELSSLSAVVTSLLADVSTSLFSEGVRR